MLEDKVQAFLPGCRKLPDYECLITYNNAIYYYVILHS